MNIRSIFKKLPEIVVINIICNSYFFVKELLECIQPGDKKAANKLYGFIFTQ